MANPKANRNCDWIITCWWRCARRQWANWCHCTIIIYWPFTTSRSVSIGSSGGNSGHRRRIEVKRWTECRCVAIEWITACCQRWCVQRQSCVKLNGGKRTSLMNVECERLITYSNACQFDTQTWICNQAKYSNANHTELIEFGIVIIIDFKQIDTD